MDLKCVSCGNSVGLDWNVCPNCGTLISIPTPEQVREGIRALRAVKERLAEEPDLSPEGRIDVMNYVDPVTEVLNNYSILLKVLIKLNDVAMDDPSVMWQKNWLKDKNSWKMNVKVVLVALGIYSHGILFTKMQNRIPIHPQGCAWISAKLDGLESITSDLITTFDKFIDTHDLFGLVQAKQVLSEAGKRLNIAQDAVDDVVKKVNK